MSSPSPAPAPPGEPTTTHLRAPNVPEVVAGHLRDQILRGELAVGESLPPEAKLLEQFGVSGPTLRAAYGILSSEGLITVRRGAKGGARVHRPSLPVAGRYLGAVLQMDGTTLADLFEARVILEPPLAGLVASKAEVAVIAELRSCVEDERQLVDDGRAFSAANVRFHECLVRSAGNRTVESLVYLVWELFKLHATGASAERPSFPGGASHRRAAVRANERLTDLVEAGDAVGAETYWREHMGAVARLYARKYGNKTAYQLSGGRTV
jgi:GntR family transcriptional repressor for pyruvate dehydrogenase complex